MLAKLLPSGSVLVGEYDLWCEYPPESPRYLALVESIRASGGPVHYAKPVAPLSLDDLIERCKRLGPHMGRHYLGQIKDLLNRNPQLKRQISTSDWGTLEAWSKGDYSSWETAAKYSLAKEIDAAAGEVEPNPSDDQKASGNYRKGHVTVQGLPITIESKAGAKRSGKGKDGKRWSVTMANHYGYIKRTESEADGDHIDVFLGPDPESEIVFVIDQRNDKDSFDEHKCMLGFTNSAAAKKAYLDNYSEGWTGFAGMKALTMEAFKKWIKDGDTGKPIEKQLLKYAFDPDEARDDDGRWTCKFLNDQVERGTSALKALPEAEEGYRTFDHAASQVRMKDMGFAGIGRLFGNRREGDEKHHTVMELDPSQVHYTQSSVMRDAVHKKLHGEFEDPAWGSIGLPGVVKDEHGKFHIQTGHHRGAAQVLATGKMLARVIQVLSRNKKGMPTYGKPKDTQGMEPERHALEAEVDRYTMVRDRHGVEGHWVTLGAKEGEDGEKHGGHHVFIAGAGPSGSSGRSRPAARPATPPTQPLTPDSDPYGDLGSGDNEPAPTAPAAQPAAAQALPPIQFDPNMSDAEFNEVARVAARNLPGPTATRIQAAVEAERQRRAAAGHQTAEDRAWTELANGTRPIRLDDVNRLGRVIQALRNEGRPTARLEVSLGTMRRRLEGQARMQQSAQQLSGTQPLTPPTNAQVASAPVRPAGPSTPRPEPNAPPRVNVGALANQYFRQIVGPGVDPAKLVGAPPASNVRMYALGTDVGIEFSGQGFRAERKITKNADGTVSCYNAEFFIDRSLQGSGFGLNVFSAQVEAMAAAGIKRIDVTAAGSSHGSSMNGYYTWPRFGYDGQLAHHHKINLPAEFRNCKTVQEVFAKPGGMAAWKEHGSTISLSFDLTPGSKSRKILERYKTERAAREATKTQGARSA